jgi:hypothetical protein
MVQVAGSFGWSDKTQWNEKTGALARMKMVLESDMCLYMGWTGVTTPPGQSPTGDDCSTLGIKARMGGPTPRGP